MKTLARLAAIALAALPLAAPAQTMTTISQPSEITVSATGVASRPPDQANFNVSIVTVDDVAATSTSKNNAIYNELRAKLGAVGVPGSSIKTHGFNVFFVPRPTGPVTNDMRRFGYTTNRSIAIATGVDGVGKAIDAAVAAGATDISNVQFSLKDRKAAYNEALAAAIADAKSQATVLAQAAGVRIIRIHSISSGSVQSRLLQTIAQVRTTASFSVPTDVSPDGPVDITATVTVSYLIQ
jgi:uncharacterized protein YggE